MHKHDFDRIKFYSKGDMAGGGYLLKAEPILKSEIKPVYEDINDVLELHNIKQYFDNEVYLKKWTQNTILEFKQRVVEYGKIVGEFMSKINDDNFIFYYEQLPYKYIDSFFELVNNHKVYKRISAKNFALILSKKAHEIRNILIYKNIVNHYNIILREFLLTYSKSAELLLSIYEKKKDFYHKEMFLPQSLTKQDKENIISNYLDFDDANFNYIQLIQNSRTQKDFAISDKTRLKAKRKDEEKTKKIFEEIGDAAIRYGTSISFAEKETKIKQVNSDNGTINYVYSLDFIKEYNDTYSLFQNFHLLFEYIDPQGIINLISKKSQIGVVESLFSNFSKNDYATGTSFKFFEMGSHCQIVGYSSVVNKHLGNSLENILQLVFTTIFQEKYNFANNARISFSLADNSYLEKVRLLAPEFESVLKQYKLFVQENEIDFELLQISSAPCSIKDIPSLIQNKYIYLNEKNKEAVECSNLFFSDQTLLTYVQPYEKKDYRSFFDLLVNEQVSIDNYEEYQKSDLNYFIDKGLIFIDESGFIQITNFERTLILKDLYENEVASFYYYPTAFQEEAKKMTEQNMIFFESSLFSKPEQDYFNYYLNKSEFTNGLELRNHYLHGTQANPEKTGEHEYAYFTYLKLLVLTLLKIENDLFISLQENKKHSTNSGCI